MSSKTRLMLILAALMLASMTPFLMASEPANAHASPPQLTDPPAPQPACMGTGHAGEDQEAGFWARVLHADCGRTDTYWVSQFGWVWITRCLQCPYGFWAYIW